MTSTHISSTPGKQGAILWLTGLSGAGKTTLSRAVAQALEAWNIPVEIIDGDTIREQFGQDLSYSREDRNANALRMGYIANLLARHNIIAIVAAISPYAEARRQVRQSSKHFVEIYVHAPLPRLIERDPKGLYKKALNGEIEYFTGISDAYEAPENPEIEIHTDRLTVEEGVDVILAYLRKEGHIPAQTTYESLRHA